MLLDELQSLLATLYRLEISVDINDFLVTDPAIVDGLLDSATAIAEEMVIVRDAVDYPAGSLDLTLYLDAAMLNRLIDADPRSQLHERNLADFCTVLEGVSHFMCLVWNAVQNKQVTQLELELQAEIDKYIGARLLLESQANNEFTPQVQAALFDSVSYRDNLSAERLARYQYANDFAGRYCYSLAQRFPQSPISHSLLDELRCFYRLPHQEKFSHMQAVQFA